MAMNDATKRKELEPESENTASTSSEDEVQVAKSEAKRFKSTPPDEVLAPEKLQSTTEILIDGKLYDVSKFKHPGGSIVKFFQGSGDASAAFEQFHVRSKKAIKMRNALPSRPAPANVVAKALPGKEKLAEDFAKLTKDLKAEGFYDPHMGQILYRISELFVLFAVGFWIFRTSSSMVIGALGLVVVGIASGRCGWLMHEGGHNSLSGNIKIDRTLQIWIYGVGCGMSGGWWRSQHNRHHATPQKLEHDPDLETLPLLAFNEACRRGIKNPIARKWLEAQAYLFMPLTCLLVVLSWQFILHPLYMFRTSKYMEAASFVVRYIAFFGFATSGYSWPASILIYLFCNQVAGSYIFTNFAMSHTHLAVTQADEHVHWCEYASEHTTNLSNHFFVNWWMAYLNFQIEHHLFPAMPQFRHPQVSLRVQALFKKHNLTYDTRGYFSCLGETLRNLDEVGHADSDKENRAAVSMENMKKLS